MGNFPVPSLGSLKLPSIILTRAWGCSTSLFPYYCCSGLSDSLSESLCGSITIVSKFEYCEGYIYERTYHANTCYDLLPGISHYEKIRSGCQGRDNLAGSYQAERNTPRLITIADLLEARSNDYSHLENELMQATGIEQVTKEERPKGRRSDLLDGKTA